jgi:hypothetical protein
MTKYRCFRIIDTKAILTHFSGKNTFVAFDELIHNVLLSFDLDKHDIIIETIDDDLIPEKVVYMHLSHSTDKPSVSTSLFSK